MATLKDTTIYGNLGVTGISNINLQTVSQVVNIRGSISGAQTINLALGNIVTATLTAATTFTFNGAANSGICSQFTLIVTNPGTYITWPTSVKWPSGTAPTLTTTGTDILIFMTVNNGTTWYGTLLSKDVR